MLMTNSNVLVPALKPLVRTKSVRFAKPADWTPLLVPLTRMSRPVLSVAQLPISRAGYQRLQELL